MPKNLKKRDPLGFFNIHSVARYQTKRRVDPLQTLKFKKKKQNRRESLKKTKNEDFEQSHSVENSEKRDPLGFSTFVLLLDIKQREGWTLCRH